MRINKDGLDIIKQFEGFSSSIYLCPAGHSTIGFGHKINDDESFYEPITLKEAEILLLNDVLKVEDYLNKIKLNLNENQFSALVSFVYNIGIGAFSNSTLLNYVKTGLLRRAADELLKWHHIKKIDSEGLLKRREAERQLFLKGMI